MFQNGNVYRVEVISNVFMEKVSKGDSYALYVSGDKVRFLRPRGVKQLFVHTLKNCNDFLYDAVEIISVETVAEWKERTA